MKKNKILIICSVFCLFLTGCDKKSTENEKPRRPAIVSPEVHADNTVTFRYLAPGAKEVKVDPQFMEGSAPMVKDEKGVWSVTLGPITPDMYPYGFIVDGITVMDDNNPFYFENERFKASIVDIEGDTPLIHSIRDVPHGTVNYDYYVSDVLGTTDTDETYFKVGRANFILDNLIAQGLAKPMIIVMPYGNPAAYFDAGDPRGAEAGKRLSEDFLHVMMPYIEKNYRTINNAENRAIGGFSRGGNQGLTIGMNNLDKFSYLCSYASFAGNVKDFETTFKPFIQNPAQTNKQINLYWLGLGTDDFLYENAKLFMDKLENNGIKTTTMITGGGHTWMNAKLYLSESAKLLFQK
ncbi:MAG: hypothetical protein LBV74_09515 [Tannerella sp.]|jgi:enterochelin esterase family protein|nr:hypothetical protein [Tannerella sp.]